MSCALKIRDRPFTSKNEERAFLHLLPLVKAKANKANLGAGKHSGIARVPVNILTVMTQIQ